MGQFLRSGAGEKQISISLMTKAQEKASTAVKKAFKQLYRAHNEDPEGDDATDAYHRWLMALHEKAKAFPNGKPTAFEAQAEAAFREDKHFVFDVVITYSMDEIDRTIPNDNLVERLADFIEEIADEDFS